MVLEGWESITVGRRHGSKRGRMTGAGNQALTPSIANKKQRGRATSRTRLYNLKAHPQRCTSSSKAALSPSPHRNWGPKLWGTLLIQTLRPEFRSQHLCHQVTTTYKPAPTSLASPETCIHVADTHNDRPTGKLTDRKHVSVCLRLCGEEGWEATAAMGQGAFSALLPCWTHRTPWDHTLGVKG